MRITNRDAIKALYKTKHKGSGLLIRGECETDLSGVELVDKSTLSFTFDDVLAKKTELQNAEPMRLLREERNRKLAKTDWRASSDLTLSRKWTSYRQALRDLPSTATPTLDDDGNLKNVTWPKEPT